MKNLIPAILILSGIIFGSAIGNELKAQDASSENQVILTEFSDYQCPACAAYHPVVEKLKEDFGDQLKVEYKHFPLNSHQFAFLAARAAESAKNQDKFHEMHNLLFNNQERWSSSGNPQALFVNYAREIGLDIEQFKNDLNNADTQRSVVEEKDEGQNRGVNGTPTFFINGQKVEQSPRSYEEFKALIQSKLEAS